MLTKAEIKYLNVQPALINPITIQEAYTFETNVIRNKLWYSGLPAMIADKLSDIVVADLDSIEVTGENYNTLWEEIRKDNKFEKRTLQTSVLKF